MISVCFSQQRVPVSSLGKAPLTSTSVFRDLPADLPDTVVHIRQEPDEPGEGNRIKFMLQKRKLPNSSFPNFYEDAGVSAQNKTNAGDLTIGATAKFSQYQQGTPPDNTMAISNRGIVVASINVKIGFYDSTGAHYGVPALDRNIATWLADPTITQNSLFDPRVIYDPKADRFIYVVMSGSSSTTCKLVIGFSQSGDPSLTWKFYTIKGFDSNTAWFDYPNVGITDNEVIITGNLFYDDSPPSYDQAAIYQINKSDGYTGAPSLNYRVWLGINDAANNAAITLVPASNGTNQSYGPNSFLVSNDPNQGNLVSLYELTGLYNTLGVNLKVKGLPVDFYSTPSTDAQQKASSRRLDIRKNRIRSAYYSNGIVHYTYITPTNTFGATPAIAYGRYDATTGANKVIYIGANGFNFAYPAISHFSNIEEKNITLLTFLNSNYTIYPEIRACIIDDKMQPSASILVKAGDGYVNYGSGTNERWGDYTGIAKKFNATRPEAWVFGCYGETSHFWGNYLAQLTALPDAVLAAAPDSFFLSPNPTMRYFILNVTAHDTAEYHFKMYSLKGQMVYEDLSIVPKGVHLKTYDLAGISPATYIVQLFRNQQKIYTTKLVLLSK
jgi:hypothetical protein